MTRRSGQDPSPDGGNNETSTGPIRSLRRFRKVGVVKIPDGKDWLSNASLSEDRTESEEQEPPDLAYRGTAQP